jgi:hypothetical protein
MPSVNSLHLQYRLWIAELNEGISVLRIFNDHLVKVSRKQNSKYTAQAEALKKRFIQIRHELDEVKHEMHLQKMKLAAIAKKSESIPDEPPENEQHNAIASRYKDFRKKFNDLKQEVIELDKD